MAAGNSGSVMTSRHWAGALGFVRVHRQALVPLDGVPAPQVAADGTMSRAWASDESRAGGLALPKSMLQAALDHDCKRAPLSLSGGRVGNDRA